MRKRLSTTAGIFILFFMFAACQTQDSCDRVCLEKYVHQSFQVQSEVKA